MKKLISFISLVLFIFTFCSSAAHALCIKVEWANLRAGPSRTNKKTWMVYQYMPFKLLKEKNGWYNVEDADGDKHWVLGKLADTKMKCAVTVRDNTAIRQGPGMDKDEVSWSPQKKNYSVKVLKTEGNWVHVVDMDKEEGWIAIQDLWIQ